MPTVTVITSYYKRVASLRRTVESILCQTFGDFEFVVIDDGSEDGTWEELTRFADERQDPRLRIVLNHPNKGFTRTMIETIKESNAPYIAVQGSGDVSLPRRLAEQIRILENRTDVTAVGCYYTNIIENTGLRRARRPNADNVDFSSLMKSNIFSHGEVTFRRSAYEKVGGYRPAFIYSQDYDLFLRLIKIGPFATAHANLYDRYVSFDGVSYVPRKFIRQAQLTLLARKLANMTGDQQKSLLERFEIDDLDSLVPLETDVLQGMVARAIVRAVVWGNHDIARELADCYVAPAWRARLALALTRGVASPAGGVALAPLRQLLGVQRQSRTKV